MKEEEEQWRRTIEKEEEQWKIKNSEEEDDNSIVFSIFFKIYLMKINNKRKRFVVLYIQKQQDKIKTTCSYLTQNYVVLSILLLFYQQLRVPRRRYKEWLYRGWFSIFFLQKTLNNI